MLTQLPRLIDFREDIRHLTKLTGIKGYFPAFGAEGRPKTFLGGSITAKFMPRPGAPQITQQHLAIIVAKDLSPLRVNRRRRLNLLIDRGDDRHALLWLDLLTLGRVPIGRISRDHLDGPPHGLGKGHELREKKLILMVGGGDHGQQRIMVAVLGIKHDQGM